MALVLMVNNYVLAKMGWEKFPHAARSSWPEIKRAFWRGLPALMTPVVILRSMVTGLVTPTEASVLAVLYAVLLGLIYGELKWQVVRDALTSTARTTTLIMFLTGVGSVMSFVITSEQVAGQLAQVLTGLTDSKWVILSLVVLCLLVLGSFMETVPAMLIGIPLFGPLVVKFGIDPVHFGVVLTYALLLGIVHPPVGLGLFTVCAVAKLKLEAVTLATMKFYPAFFVVLLLYMFVPSLSTWLPGVMFAKAGSP
jgi:tripartite ATP-independent transporter DctM subunit